MSQEQQFLSPDQQNKLFQHLKDIGALSSDVGQSANVPDEQAQSGFNIDPTTLHSIIQHAVNPNSVPMQDGDKLHPMDAMNQIASQMLGPSKPSGIENTGGPQLYQDKRGQLMANTITEAPIGRLLGIHQPTPVSGTNYFEAAKQAGLDKFLPTGLPRMPDGSPLVDDKAFQHALTARRVTAGQGTETYSKDELLAQGVPEEVANKLIASATAAGKTGVSSKELSNFMGSERIKSSQQLADARSQMAAMAVLAKKLQVGGFNAAQPLVESSFKNVGLANRAQAAIDQINESGGVANQAQRAELAAALGSLTGQNAGVLTDERMNQFLPQSAKAKFGNWVAYWTNENQPIDFTGFLPQLQDLLTREKQANQGMIQAGQSLGMNILAQTQPGPAKALQTNFNANPLVNSAPTPAPKSNGAWRVVR